LRELTGRRRALVGAVARDAVRLGEQAGVPVTSGLRLEVEEALEAALADPATGEQLREGRLTRLGDRSSDLADWATPTPATRSGRAGGRETDARVSAAKAAREAAAQSLREAQRARDVAAERAAASTAAVDSLTGTLRDLRDQMADVERRLAEATLEARARAREAERAEAAVADARRAVAAARRRSR